jgi:Zinc dependent phospholipase C
MPWPMIHFAIANRYLHSPAYLLGSIAPDAVLARENIQDSKVKSHLGRNTSLNDYLDFLKKNVDLSINSNEHINFFLGYISHIYVDTKWSELKSRIANMDRNITKCLWQEENQMDFHLYRSEPWVKQVVRDVMESPLYDVNGIFEKSELNRWRIRVFEWLEHADNEPKIINEFITDIVVKEFIAHMTEELRSLDSELLKQLKNDSSII